METISHLDYQCFHWLQSTFSNTLFDALLPFWREKLFWSPLYIFGISYLLINYQKKGFGVLFFILLAVSCSDIICSSIIKPLIARPRPCHELNQAVNLLVECGNGFSFPSAHAANHFALATIVANVFFSKRRFMKYILYIWAGSIAFAQVYVGVHYPIDVICGTLLGITVGILFAKWYQIFAAKANQS